MGTKHCGHWLSVSLVVAILTGCGPMVTETGSGHVVEKERQTPDFVALEVSDSIQATVVVDAAQPKKVRLVGDDNLVAKMRTELKGDNTLHIHFDPDDLFQWSSPNPLRVEVTVPKLEALSIAEAGTVELSGAITSTTFSLSARGASTVKTRGLATESLNLELSGASVVTVEGHAPHVTTHLSGSSQLKGRQLSVREASLHSSGASSTELQVSDSLRVTASGGSSVLIIGRPTVRSQNLTGGASLRFE